MAALCTTCCPSRVTAVRKSDTGLFAGLNAPGQTVVIEREATRDHTERMLAGFGAQIEVEMTAEGKVITLTGQPELKPQHIVVPRDPSSAAFPVCAALIVEGSDVLVPNIGLNPTPDAMRARLWDQDWFEDPVWSKPRMNAINAHFISAFLDRYLKGDETRAAYLDVAVPESAAGVWPATKVAAYEDYSDAADGVTVWKGFQRGHATGLQLLRADALPAAD